MVDFSVGVVIAAAGCGSRFGGYTPKQYCKILEKPLFLYAVEEFVNIPWVKKLALVADNPDSVQTILEECRINNGDKVIVVKGEQTRHRSIKAGLHELQKETDELRIVVVHDGVRPLVPKYLVQELVTSAEQQGAAGATRPLVSTVLRVAPDGLLEESLDRSGHAASETPQAFQLAVLASAYSKCSEEDLDHGTECLQLALKYAGVRAKLIPGPEELFKVTYKKDLYTATSCIRERQNNVCIIAAENTGAIRLLEDSLSTKVAIVKRVSSWSQCDSDKENTFNTVILFHLHEIQQDQHLGDLAAMLDIEKQGLIIHVIDNANIDGMQSMSVYNLHRSGRTMAYHYDKLHKGVIVIHCVTNNEDQQLVDLITSLIQANPSTFSGQTLFI